MRSNVLFGVLPTAALVAGVAGAVNVVRAPEGATPVRTVIVQDTTPWIVAGEQFGINPHQSLFLQYEMKDLDTHNTFPGAFDSWIAEGAQNFEVEPNPPGFGGGYRMHVGYGNAQPGDSLRFVFTLVAPWPKVGADSLETWPHALLFLYGTNTDQYECSSVIDPDVQVNDGRSRVLARGEGVLVAWGCHRAVRFPVTIEVELLGPDARNRYGVRIRTLDGLTNDPAPNELPSVTILSGAWGDGTTGDRACETNAEGWCGPGNVAEGTTIRVTLPGNRAIYVERTAGG